MMLIVNVSTFILLLMSALHVQPSSSSVIPSPEVLEAFVVEFQKEGITIVLPENKSNKWPLLSQIKHFRSVLKFVCQIQLLTLFLGFSSANLE